MKENRRLLASEHHMLHVLVYQNLTSNDRYLDYRNNNPTPHNANMNMALENTKIVINTRSSDEHQRTEMQKVAHTLLNNCYP